MILLVLACGKPPTPFAAPTLRDRMHVHFAHATNAVYGVILGDLDRARVEAAQLRDLGPIDELPPAWKPAVDALRLAAARAADSPDLDAAAVDVAALGLACAGCHQLAGATPAVDAGDPTEHAWAAYGLWVGLVVPSDEVFRASAAALARDEALPPLPEELAPLELRVHAIGTTGAAAVDPDTRVGAMADLLRSCAECHDAAGVTLPR